VGEGELHPSNTQVREAEARARSAEERERGLREAIERAAEKLDTAYWKMTEDEDVDSQIILAYE
jgi:hypothetical protein